MNILFSAAGAKAPRKIISCPTTSSAGATTSDSSKGENLHVDETCYLNHTVSVLSLSGMLTGKGNTAGNPYFPRETPAWQKEITHYFKSATMESKKKHEAPPNENSREMTTVLYSLHP
jgi:hypothetical protein